MKKIYLRCGYEDECKTKDCLRCKKQYKKHHLNLGLAELSVIEDFAVCDIENMIKHKKDELELMQEIMFKIMKKVFKKK